MNRANHCLRKCLTACHPLLADHRCSRGRMCRTEQRAFTKTHAHTHTRLTHCWFFHTAYNYKTAASSCKRAVKRLSVFCFLLPLHLHKRQSILHKNNPSGLKVSLPFVWLALNVKTRRTCCPHGKCMSLFTSSSSMELNRKTVSLMSLFVFASWMEFTSSDPSATYCSFISSKLRTLQQST